MPGISARSIEIIGPYRMLLLAYAPSAIRAALAVLWELDVKLRGFAMTGHDPMLTRIKLQWWVDRLSALDADRLQDEPLLKRLALHFGARNGASAQLAELASAWQHVAGIDEMGQGELDAFADRHGKACMSLIAMLLDYAPTRRTERTGRLWALASFAEMLPDGDLRARVGAMAQPWLLENEAGQRRLRAPILSLLDLVSRRILLSADGKGTVSPQLMLRLLWHRLTGL